MILRIPPDKKAPKPVESEIRHVEVMWVQNVT
jgi:hypothetical protein